MIRPLGIYSAMLTPWKNGQPDLDELRKIVDFQIDAGLSGLFPVSSVGESGLMSFEQKCSLMETVIHQAAGRVPVWCGIPSSCAQESIALGKFAKEQGATGLVLMPPTFYRHAPDVIVATMKAIIESTTLPVSLYNIPFFADALTPAMVAELARLPNVVGIKDSGGNAVEFMQMLSLCKEADPQFCVLTGREEFLYPSLKAGGKGCMTATSGVLPEVMVKIYQLTQAGRDEEALALQMAALPVMMMMASLPFPMGYKLGMEIRGFSMGESPFPQIDAVKEKANSIKNKLEKALQQLLTIAN
ncbi:Dihydrodipicolinate synthase [Leminorella richardii]|uniref:Dihydrodipicolinate synthase n=1 Tax=Leminorella richardii TaxID=158841 RepID=A0A2X4URD9_9GAMM|nr:dihydrodipicolinate synthase family protein [Leminorella richardii]SQI41351.1 Dihydrodipicolinate synthase [Leminorella richardii]